MNPFCHGCMLNSSSFAKITWKLHVVDLLHWGQSRSFGLACLVRHARNDASFSGIGLNWRIRKLRHIWLWSLQILKLPAQLGHLYRKTILLHLKIVKYQFTFLHHFPHQGRRNVLKNGWAKPQIFATTMYRRYIQVARILQLWEIFCPWSLKNWLGKYPPCPPSSTLLYYTNVVQTFFCKTSLCFLKIWSINLV